MRVAVITFPGSNCDTDAIHAFREILGAEVAHIWHKDTQLPNPDLVFIPGGFSFGDYLRTGAIARFSPIMEEVRAFHKRGGYVFGVCNGFQILCEMGLLPGALLTNQHLKFLCQDTWLKVAGTANAFTGHLAPGRVLQVPIAHGMGQYFAEKAVLERLEAENRVVFRYCNPQGELSAEANPNGSVNAIAGITSACGRILGMMPHPERHVEAELGTTDGLAILSGIFHHLQKAA